MSRNRAKAQLLPLHIYFLRSSSPHTYFSQRGFLISQSNNEDAISLTNAALSPWGHAVVRLVKDNPIDVLLLGKPARETILMDTEIRETKTRMRR